MLKPSFEELKKPLATVLITGVLVVGLGLGFNYLRNRPYVPEEFSAARIEGAQASQDINALLNTSLQNLSEIERLDRQWSFGAAYAIANKEFENIEEKRAAASRLATAMSAMASAIPRIQPKEASELALEAVSTQVAAVSHISSYNDYLIELFRALGFKFGTGAYDGAQVQELIVKMNAEGVEINRLTEKFDQLLKEFDAMYL